jgi:purine nucleoside permease
VYGTEAFELNDNLRERFVALASIPKLNDTVAAAAYRAKYPYAPANKPPSVVKCSSGTSNVYW